MSLYRPNRHPTLSQSEQIAIYETTCSTQYTCTYFTDTNIDIIKHGVNPIADFLIDLSMS